MTTSELVLQPTPEDNGKIVTCSVTTEAINGGTGLFLKDSRFLDVKRRLICLCLSACLFIFLSGVLQESPIVTDAPIVSLSLGQPLDAHKLMNGSDVFLECYTRANPAIKKIEWFHNVRPSSQPTRPAAVLSWDAF